MVWMIISAGGVWIALSAFILLILCMNSSRISHMEEPAKRPSARSRVYRKRTAPSVQPSTIITSGD
jgi:hypothetical protein